VQHLQQTETMPAKQELIHYSLSVFMRR